SPCRSSANSPTRPASSSCTADGPWNAPSPGSIVYVVEVSAALLIEAASVSTYRLVSDRVSSHPIPDSGPDTVRARGRRLPSGCGSTTCAAVTVTPGEVDSQATSGPLAPASSVVLAPAPAASVLP